MEVIAQWQSEVNRMVAPRGQKTIMHIIHYISVYPTLRRQRALPLGFEHRAWECLDKPGICLRLWLAVRIVQRLTPFRELSAMFTGVRLRELQNAKQELFRMASILLQTHWLSLVFVPTSSWTDTFQSAAALWLLRIGLIRHFELVCVRNLLLKFTEKKWIQTRVFRRYYRLENEWFEAPRYDAC